MLNSVFVEMQFWLLVVFSLLLPAAVYWGLLVKHAISRYTVLVFGVALVLIAGVDVYLLQSLAVKAKATISSVDDSVFLSELSVALYLFPLAFGGVGVNLISHVLVQHLEKAEARFDTAHPEDNKH